MQKTLPQKNKIQATSLYSEKSLLAQCPFWIDICDVAILLLFLIIDFKFLLAKDWSEISWVDELEIFSWYLKARFWIENPFAFERCGQKFFTIKINLFPKGKLIKIELQQNTFFITNLIEIFPDAK